MIGFIGSDKYDFISYIGKILSGLGKKVLLVDYTALRSLMSTIPDYIDSRTMQYKELFYLGNPGIGEIEEMIQNEEYDFILMDFDYSVMRRDAFLCHKLVFITDVQRHHLEVLESMKLSKNIQKYLVLKMEYRNRKASAYLKQIRKNMEIQEERCFYYTWGDRERRNQLRSQYYYEISWKRCSSTTKKIILYLVHEFLEVPKNQNSLSIPIQAGQVG